MLLGWSRSRTRYHATQVERDDPETRRGDLTIWPVAGEPAQVVLTASLTIYKAIARTHKLKERLQIVDYLYEQPPNSPFC